MRRGLGKGLSQLVASEYEAPEVEESPTTEARVDSISPNSRQPRRRFDQTALEELAHSIREHGILQPIAVRRLSGGKYELIAGERRLRAAKLLNLETVPIVIRDANDRDSLELALVENVQREDIGAMECARAYKQLQDEFKLTQDQVADRVGKSRTAVTNTLRLLKLPQRIQKALEEGHISEGHARALLALPTEAQQLLALEAIIARGLSVREVEGMARAEGAERKKPDARPPGPVDPNWRTLEDALSTYFAAPVKLQKEKDKGRITIEFYSDDDLDRLLEVLGIRL